MACFWRGLSHTDSLVRNSGDVLAQQGRNLSEGRGQSYGHFEETGLVPEAEQEQTDQDLDNTDLLVQYEGPTRDGALHLSFDYRKQEQQQLHHHHHHQKANRSPRGHNKEAHKPPEAEPHDSQASNEESWTINKDLTVPKLTIVMMVTGTRGDVQPFLALGLKLQEYGHRVRLASHAVYREVVLGCGLEFYPLGGDPKVLSEYIVKNRGIMPSSTKDVMVNYRQVEAVVMSTYDACVAPDPEGDGRAFKAEAIISNPPCYGHIHCAEKLQVPLHMMFTMPWSATKAFPHPLARLNPVKDSQMAGVRNSLSYVVINEMVHDGLLPIINNFRRNTLHLSPLRLGDRGAHALSLHKVPFSYCWSPAVVPKPLDWFGNIDVVGYFFLNESTRNPYSPPDKLRDFLAAGAAPVYIGFGSLVVDDPQGLSSTILKAADRVRDTGQRILLSRGWGKLGEGFDVPDNVLLLDSCPHDWLLPRCSAVVHHGGAGTTAAGLMAGCPTTVVPFFGDQSFWGGACNRLGVGPAPIAIDDLTTDKLVDALDFMRQPDAIAAAKRIAAEIAKENGVAEGVASFHRHLPVEDLIGGHPTVWHLAEPGITDVFSEMGTGVIGFFTHPYRAAKREGATGAVVGFAKGVGGLGWHPVKGLYLSGQALTNRASDLTHVSGQYMIHPRRSAPEGDTTKHKAGQGEDIQHDASHARERDEGAAQSGSKEGLMTHFSKMMPSMHSRKHEAPLSVQENSPEGEDACADPQGKVTNPKYRRFLFNIKKGP